MFAWFYFSHHPLCKNYRHEVINVNGLYLCKGCTEVYGSSLFIILLVALFNPFHYLNILQLLIIAILAVLPSVIGNIIHFKKRIIKDAIRIILGIGWGIALSSLFFNPSLVVKIEVFFVMIVIYFIFKFTRTFRGLPYHDDLCENCMQFNEQACEPYKRVFVTEREYSRVLSDYIQERLSVNRIKGMGFNNFMQDD